MTNPNPKNIDLKMAYLDDVAYPIYPGETILSFIKRQRGKGSIPTLCDAENLEPFGSCRVCSVEVALKKGGKTKVLASCHSPISEGQYIYSETSRIQRLRKNIIELVLTDHPLDCLTCEVSGNCELQDVAARVGIREVRYPKGKTHLDTSKDLSHVYMTSDLAKCINCYRCVRVCDEVQGQFVLNMVGRGFDTRIIKGMDTTFAASDCVSCGACSQACPTSAISDVFESKSVRVGAQNTRTICTYCGVGCNLEITTVGKEIKSIQAPYDAEVNQGHTCLKGRFAFRFYNHPDRLRSPLIRRNGKLEEVSWEEAYDFITHKLKEIKSKHGADAIAGVSSSRCTNEENYLMQKFMRAVIGTNNIDGCARVCHSPTALGMQRTFGTGAATNSIEDLKHTDCILVIGANPTEGHPVTGAKIKQQAMKGKTLIVLDPRRTEIAKYAHHHIPLRPGSNVAVLNMMFYYIIKENLVDKDFVDKRTIGYEDFKNHILNLNIDELEEVCGVDRNSIRDAAIAYASAKNAMAFHGLGVTEHSQGTFTVMLIADLAMITGNIGRKGVGVNPLRGQNNVQGAADMGVQPHQGAGYLDVTKPEVNKMYSAYYGVSVPDKVGYKIPEMMDAALSGDLKALWVMGEDLVQTDPNSQKVRKAMRSLELLVVQEIFHTETTKEAHVILPAASFLEKSGTFTNGERRVQRVQKVIDPIGMCKADGQIIVDIMNRMGYPQEDYDAEKTLAEVAGIVPFFKGIKWKDLGATGKQWPVAPDGTDTKILHREEFKIGKGRFAAFDFEESEEIVKYAKDYPYILTTNRNLEHYNCGTMTRRTDNRVLVQEDAFFIHPQDAMKHGIKDRDMVRIESPRGSITLRAAISEDIKPGIFSTTFHFPDIMVNDLTSDVYDSEAKCPEYKVVAVRIERL